jgi:hypothetical protein
MSDKNEENKQSCTCMTGFENGFYILGIIYTVLIFVIIVVWIIIAQYYSFNIYMIPLPPKNLLQKA